METHIAFPGLQDARSSALFELLMPGGGAPNSTGRCSATVDLGVPSEASPAPATGALADTPYAAAWLLLRARWLAETAPVLHEAGADEGRAIATTLGECVPTATAGEWIAKVDQSRSHNGNPPDGSTATPPAVVWLRYGKTGMGAQTAVRLWVEEGVPGRRLHADADAQVLNADALWTLLSAIATTADQLLAQSDAPLSSIRTVTPADRHAQLVAWNRPLPAVDDSITVTGRFKAQARIDPDAIALIEGDTPMSYGELDRRSSRLARHLEASGVRVGDRVGLVLDRSTDAVVAQLAILRAGAAYVPIPTDYPPERVAAMLAQAAVRHVVIRGAHSRLVPEHIARIDLNDWNAAHEASTGDDPATSGESGAYVMYTSGSTGTPKAIEISHRAILRLVINAEFANFGPGKPMLHAAPLGFDAATLEIWGPLLNGGCCVIHDERVPTGGGLARTIARHGVHTAWLTAALFNAIIDDNTAHLGGLRHLITGGEALSVTHVRRALSALPHLALSNGYGPTECTTFAATYRIPADLPEGLRSVPLGRPIQQTVLRVLSPAMDLLPTGLIGELYIGGHGLAHGYLGQPALSAKHFIADPFGEPGERLYRTGDLARWLADGTLEFIGRCDDQVKIHGHRVEPGEVEAALLSHPAIRSCAVVVHPDAEGRPRLVAYLVPREDSLPGDTLRAYLCERLPAAMLPSAQVWLPELPRTPNGKLDRKALPAPTQTRPDLSQPYAEPETLAEREVCEAFAHVLQVDKVGRDDNFFDLGGDSLRVLQVLSVLQRQGGGGLSTNLFFRHPTPAAMAAHLQAAHLQAATVVKEGQQPSGDARSATPAEPFASEDAIALIGTAGRFPGAADVEQFWDNLVAGRDTVTFFDDSTLDASVSAALRADPSYVRARGVIDGIEDFDAAFFGISPNEAALMDPQQRVFLEICWECLERAGYVPDAAQGPVGVYAGMYNATYAQRHLSTRPDLVEALGDFQAMLANEKDYITTRVAHRLNLTGPAVSVHTACSTSLVAVAQAFHALRSGQCYMALAGGASVTCPPRSGYLYNEGSMLSPDGRTRSFDAKAQGTVFSDGAAVVLLKRLADAQADGDTIYAVLRSASVNNDGGAKASFTAPSVDGQAAVIRAALKAAGVNARSISYVEAHGTATPMGDPVEVEALATAFGEHTDARGFCTLGSLKSNTGHMVTAAGAAGLIKTALALHHGQIPPTAHFSAPNPAIEFTRTPFRVTADLTPWPRGAHPRRAGVSSFGVGGTNAHVIVEEAPVQPPSPSEAGVHILPLSARSEAALAVATERLAGHIQAHPQLALGDVAFTLAAGRKMHAFRRAVVASTGGEAVAALRDPASPWRTSGNVGARSRQLVLMFPGQGAQYAGMGQALYGSDPVFAAAFDECIDAFSGQLEYDLRARIFSGEAQSLVPTSVTQPALFAIEYALARRLLSLGARPKALIGHSVGEFAAAVVAGVMRLEDAARLVAQRGLLMQAQLPGSMLSVNLGAEELLPQLGPLLSLAADNGPKACVASGPADAIAALHERLQQDGVACRPLQTSHAFHSTMMDAVVPLFEALVSQVALSPPQIPIISTLTGLTLEPAEATSPGYWARHVRGTVRFAPAVRQAIADIPQALFVECGPRNTLATLVRQQGAMAATLLHGDAPDEAATLRLGIARLWTSGAEIDLSHLASTRRRVQLPTYPFERKRFWVDIATAAVPAMQHSAPVVASLIPNLPLEPTMNATSVPPAPSAPSASSASSAPPVETRLRALLEDISGIDMAQADGHALFAELGLDSLTLTQAATQVKKLFKVDLSFRQLMVDYRSIDALATYLSERLPRSAETADKAITPTPAAPVANVASLRVAPQEVGGGGMPLPQLIAQQMEIMRLQLALLSGSPQGGSTPSVAGSDASQGLADERLNAVVPGNAAPISAQQPPQRYDVSKAFGAIARIHTQRTAEPSARQKARLGAFIRRYVERTAKSKQFTEANRSHMADPRVVNGFRPLTKEIVYQIVIDRSEGAHLWDIDGNAYVDALNGFGVNMFGWQPKFVRDTVRQQLDAGCEIGPQHPLAADVTRLVCELTSSDRAGLCNTGSEAVMAALRIARTVTGRSTVVVFTGSYHGTFDEVLVRAGKDGKGLSAAPGVMAGMFGDIRVLDYGTPEALDFIRNNAADLAAVLVEPVQSRRPEFQPREFLKEVRAITEHKGCCLIFDEVITGFRAALGGAQALFGIRADLATYGKVIGGGFPIGVIAGKREFMDALDGGSWQYGDDSVPSVGVTYFAGTFVRHPITLAAAKASLIHLKHCGPALQEGLALRTGNMADELTAWCAEVGAPIAIRHFASLWRVGWLEDHPYQDLLFAMMRSRGVHILENFPCFLTSAHSAEDIAVIQQAFKDSVEELQESGFLPRRAPVTTQFDRPRVPADGPPTESPAHRPLAPLVAAGERAVA